jgi:hypothetical protein
VGASVVGRFVTAAIVVAPVEVPLLVGVPAPEPAETNARCGAIYCPMLCDTSTTKPHGLHDRLMRCRRNP